MRARTYMATVATASLLAFPAMVAAQTETMESQEETGAQTEMQEDQTETGAQTEMETEEDVGAEAGMEREGEGGFITSAPADAVKLNDLSGYSVLGVDDEEIGTVQDILVNPDGEVAALVLSSGGFLGMGDKTVALEWSGITVNAQEEELQTQMTREDIEGAPEYEDRNESETGTE